MTFLGAGSVNLTERGIDERQAADVQQRLNSFAEDWEQPGMEIIAGVR